MTDKQIIIDDQKKTIHRLQDECTEKTNAIIALGEKLKIKEQECEELKYKIFRYDELLKHSAMAQNTYTAEEVNTIASGIKFVGNSLIAEENNRLHKTLTEIKEIAEPYYTLGSKDSPVAQILQKISECEVVDG